MTLYTIILNDPNQAAWDKLRSLWPAHHRIVNDCMAFLCGDGLQTGEIAVKIGIGKRMDGLVVQADDYAGHAAPGIVEWIRERQ